MDLIVEVLDYSVRISILYFTRGNKGTAPTIAEYKHIH